MSNDRSLFTDTLLAAGTVTTTVAIIGAGLGALLLTARLLAWAGILP